MEKNLLLWMAIPFLVCILPISKLNALDNNAEKQARIKSVRLLLETPEARVDFALAKLTLDQWIDPHIDIQQQNKRLNQMAGEVFRLTGKPFPSPSEKKEALRRYLYEAGEWNQHQPFSYDLNDPLGTQITAKLLPNYLDSRKGNCLSMPALFIILGQKIGIDVTLSTAPQHVFVKYTDNTTGKTYNLETTSGANLAREAWLSDNLPMTKQAIETGIYLQKLNKKEAVAVMADTLVQYEMEQGHYQQAIQLADLILQHYPKSVNAMIYTSQAFDGLLKQKGLAHYFSPDEVPFPQREAFTYLVSNKNSYYRYAESLGYKSPSVAENQAYINTVKNAVKH